MRVGDGYPRSAPARGLDGRETHYTADADEFAAALDYRAVGEPLLGAAVRERWLRRWVPLGPGQLILDIGAGEGASPSGAATSGARIVALDAAPFFADAAVAPNSIWRSAMCAPCPSRPGPSTPPTRST